MSADRYGSRWTPGAFLEAEDVFELVLGGVLEELIDLFDSGGTLDFEDAVRQRGVGQWNAYGVTIQATTQLRENFRNRGGRAGAGRNQTHPRGTRSAQVLVRLIENALGVGQVVDGGDRTVANAQFLVDDFHHRRQAVGRA